MSTTRNLIGIFLVLNLAMWTAGANAMDFSQYENESELFQLVRKIPASDKSANAAGYARLLALNPNKDMYWAKFERYSGGDETGMLKIVKAIPASNRSANAAGYARLLSLDPNNGLYRSKLAKYSSQSNRPTSVDSVSGLRSYLAGSWCALDDDPTYVAGPHVKKLVILADGNYRLFSKPASALAWSSTKQQGRMLFREGRHQETGEKYYYAVSREFGSPKLVVDTDGRSVSWHRVMDDLGKATRESCNKFE